MDAHPENTKTHHYVSKIKNADLEKSLSRPMLFYSTNYWHYMMGNMTKITMH